MNIRRRKEWDQRGEEKRVGGEEAKKKNQWEMNRKRSEEQKGRWDVKRRS